MQLHIVISNTIECTTHTPPSPLPRAACANFNHIGGTWTNHIGGTWTSTHPLGSLEMKLWALAAIAAATTASWLAPVANAMLS